VGNDRDTEQFRSENLSRAPIVCAIDVDDIDASTPQQSNCLKQAARITPCSVWLMRASPYQVWHLDFIQETKNLPLRRKQYER